VEEKQVKTKTQPSNQERREFIRKTTLVGAGAAAAAVAGGAVIADSGAQESEKPAQKGYQLTPHVLAYYKSADI
jgi:nitrous oxide reductase